MLAGSAGPQEKGTQEKIAEFFAVSPPGLEGLLEEEFRSLGLPFRREEGGLSFTGTWREMARVNLWSRVASRVLMRWARFRTDSFPELERRTRSLPWERYLPPDWEIRFRVTSYRSRLYHEGAIRERLERVVRKRLGREDLTGSKGKIVVVVRLVKDVCTISIDTSGGDLFRRGYKVAPGPAALRENLAAALVLSSGWRPGQPLLDPFCGTGTIPAEAAMIAANRAPGILRRFPFEDWPDFDPGLWEELREEARKKERPAPDRPFIFAADASEKSLAATRENLKAAGVKDWVQIFRASFKDLRPPARPPGHIVTDPPYGKRLSSRALFPTYRLLGEAFRERFRGWHLTLIFPETGIRRLSALSGLRFKRLLSTEHGGFRCAFLKAL